MRISIIGIIDLFIEIEMNIAIMRELHENRYGVTLVKRIRPSMREGAPKESSSALLSIAFHFPEDSSCERERIDEMC